MLFDEEGLSSPSDGIQEIDDAGFRGEYSAPTTARPSVAISSSISCDPCRRWFSEARMFARIACRTRAAGVVSELRLQQLFDGRPNAIDDRVQISRRLFGESLQRLERRMNSAALRVSEHHDEPRAEPLGREFHAADLRRRDYIPRDADHEQVPEALVENDLRGYAGIGTAENDRKGSWPAARSRWRVIVSRLPA
jgi:hypothetical protein